MSQHDTDTARSRPAPFPFSELPPPSKSDAKAQPAPDAEQCFGLWNKYEMLENIRRHSLMVASIAAGLAEKAEARGMDVDVCSCRAAGLLHDIAKTWCVKHGGSHAIIGASWTVQETRNYAVAQGVLLHVHWPWRLPEGDAICCLPIFVIYADKRVRHDQFVTLDERFDDLITRYGKTASARDNIRKSHEQAKQIEMALSRQLGWHLNEDSFDRWRLVD